jgi:hypothetical protein
MKNASHISQVFWPKGFHFYHPDLGPGNIMVSANGEVTGILDWEATGFYPSFWIATKPSVAPDLDFYPSEPEIDDYEWRRSLKIKLESRCYPQAAAWYMTRMANRPLKL